MKLSLWSNVFFIAPIVLSAYHKIYWHLIALLLMTVFSVLYHFTERKHFKLSDNIFAQVLIATNLILLYLSGFEKVYTIIAFVFVAVAFYFYFTGIKNNYEYNHAMWHITSAFITLSCILAYITA